MKKLTNLDGALQWIDELKNENAEVKAKLEYFKKRKASGRQKHNTKWMAIYRDFVDCYEKGMALVEIAERNGISLRSMYKYKAYYEQMQRAI